MLKKWQLFSYELGKLFQLWCFGIFFFFLYRLSFILLFRAEIQDSISVAEYAKVFFTGFRSDAMMMAYVFILPILSLFIFSTLGLKKWLVAVRKIISTLFIFLSVTICLISLNYYNEFHVNFDNNLYLGLFEEDFSVVLKMLIQQKNSLIFILLYISILSVTFLLYKNRPKDSFIAQFCQKLTKLWSRALIIVVVLILFVGSFRGSFSKHNFRVRNSAVSKVYVLNRSILNPFKSLEISFKDYKMRNSLLENSQYSDSKFCNLESFKQGLKSIEHTVGTDHLTISKPKQIFVVIMESYDYWSLDEKYKPFNVSNNLARIADSGISFSNFLPAYNATIYAYTSIITSVPYFGVNMAQVETNQSGESCISLFNEFEKMGYKTNFFYGGFLSWQKIEDYSMKLSCDNIYSAADVDEGINDGLWGMEDEKLFDLVLDKVNPDEYTFNVILTTSYHNPFPIDVLSKGYPYETIEDLPESMRPYFDGTITLNELGHRWYGDFAIGQFMDNAEEKYSDALYAYTGDHYARKFINANPTLYEKSLVPFVLYGKGIPAQKLDTPGSHIDILPTLVELVAPPGFVYSSFGSSMLNDKKNMGIAYGKLITRDNLYAKIDDNTIEKINKLTGKSVIIEALPYSDNYKDIMELAWYYVTDTKRSKF